MNVQDQLKEFVTSEFMYEQDSKSLSPDLDLLNQGIIDSMGILDLVSYMEKTFNIQVTDEEITPNNFRNLKALTQFVQAKVQN